MKPTINVILFEPLIAENTGNIARSCVAFDATLHLIRPYGFFLNSHQFKRAAVNYLENLKICEYDSFEDFLLQNKYPSQIIMYTRYGNKTPNQINYINNKNMPIYIMFGKETTGIPEVILNRYKQSLVRIPTSSNVRSINLSNTVAIALYEIIRQFEFNDLCLQEPFKSKQFD